MSWLGDFVGELAGALFPGARAIVKNTVDRAVEIVVRAGKAFVANWLNNAAESASSSPAATAKDLRSKAMDLAEEEVYLAKKIQRDGHRSPADADRIHEIEASRENLRDKLGKISALQSATDIAESVGLISVKTSQDELASQVGILSTKQCPTCSGVMTLQLGSFNVDTGQKFKWRCTSVRQPPCKEIYVSPAELTQQVSVRKPHADLDIDPAQRKEWEDPGLLANTAGRVRQHLGYNDEAIICPIHLLPMKLLPTANAGGLLLNTYQYTCLGVFPDGRACSHTVPLTAFGQVSGLLTRTEGRGIL